MSHGGRITATILLFEDDPDIGLLVAELLGERGHRVDRLPSLDVAPQVVERERPALILADSPTATRSAALEGIRRCCREVRGMAPVVAFTAHNLTPDEVRELGCVDALPKPFDLDDLVRRVDALLASGGGDSTDRSSRA